MPYFNSTLNKLNLKLRGFTLIFKSIKMYVQMKIDADAINEFKGIISETVEKVMKDILLKEKESNKAINTDDKLLTRAEVMNMLQVSHATLYRYQRDEIIPFLKIGNRVYFKRKDILDNPKLIGDPWDYD